MYCVNNILPGSLVVKTFLNKNLIIALLSGHLLPAPNRLDLAAGAANALIRRIELTRFARAAIPAFMRHHISAAGHTRVSMAPPPCVVLPANAERGDGGRTTVDRAAIPALPARSGTGAHFGLIHRILLSIPEQQKAPRPVSDEGLADPSGYSIHPSARSSPPGRNAVV